MRNWGRGGGRRECRYERESGNYEKERWRERELGEEGEEHGSQRTECSRCTGERWRKRKGGENRDYMCLRHYINDERRGALERM